MPASAIVGISGNTSERLLLVTASARRLPPLMALAAAARDMNAICVCPAIVDVMAGTAPLNGT